MKKKSINNIFICATEQSGDNIGEKIIKELKKKKVNYLIDGVGGERIAPFLRKQFYSLKDFKSIGIIEIIGSIKKYLFIIEKLSQIIILNNYKVVITVDSPDFNFRLAKKIKKKGFKGKIVQIVAPTVWAWRKNRAKDFSEIFDKLLVIFPFEKKYFDKYNLSTTYIGHPIYYINNFKINIQNKYIAFLPGSREGEVLSLIKYFKVIANNLDSISSNLEIFIPTIPHLKLRLIHLTKDWNNQPIIETKHNKIEEFFSQTCLAVVCSGTASLEVAKRKIPQLVIYKLNLFTEMILKMLVTIKYANIINIMADNMIIPEIINSKLKENSIWEGFKELFNNYLNNNDKQIIFSKVFLDKLILKKSPAEIASKEIEELFFPKPLKD